MYLGDREVLRYSPDEADLLAVERKVLALWEAIERATQLREFRARPSRLCDWCDHQALCPAFGGTPPPFPEVVPAPTCCCPTSSGRRRRRRSAGADGTALPVQHSADERDRAAHRHPPRPAASHRRRPRDELVTAP
jgi:hypothetical protein